MGTNSIGGGLQFVSGPCYFTGSYPSSNLIATVAVQADNPEGGNPLTGSVGIPIKYSSNPSTPILSFGGMANAASHESGPLAPSELFSLSGTFPGVPTVGAEALPLGTSLGGVQVLIDGVAAPLYFTDSTEVIGILPATMASGRHNAAAVANGMLSGARSSVRRTQTRPLSPRMETRFCSRPMDRWCRQPMRPAWATS